MKKASISLKILTCLAAVATLVLFFFPFIEITGHYTLTGMEAAFGASRDVGTTYKSAWYAFAFILGALTLVFSGLSFKSKGCKYASMGFSLAFAINMLVIYCTPVLNFFDVRPLTVGSSDIHRQLFFTLAFVASLVTFVLSFITMFVADYAEVLESNGAKITISRRIKRFFKDYKSEITKIVWPSRNTVVKNVIVVLVMCLVVGAYIWILDYGLGTFINFVVQAKG